MSRKHGDEAIAARRGRAEDEIAQLRLNPEVTAAEDAIRKHAEREYADGERLFDNNPRAGRMSSSTTVADSQASVALN